MNPQLMFLGRGLFDLDGTMFANMAPNLFNFVLVAALLSFLLYNPVKRILQVRADRIASEIAGAEAANQTAMELKASYEQKVRDIELERASIIDEARKTAGERRNQILDEAKTEAHEVKERAARDIATEKEQIKAAVHEAIIDISTEMAQRLISATIDKSAHDRLFAEAMAELESTVLRQDAVVV